MGDYEYQQLENSSIRMAVHKPENCMSEICTIHQRTDHSMRRFPQIWRGDRKLMMRTCPHDVQHPDPDDFKIIDGIDNGEHDCDGCCIQFLDEEPDYNANND